jgi:hypothetical protein
MTKSPQSSTRAHRHPIDTRVPIVSWSTAPGSLLGIDVALFMRIDGVSNVHALADMIGEPEPTVVQALARLESRGLLTFLPSVSDGTAEPTLADLELDAVRSEEARDTVPQVPSAQLVESTVRAPAGAVAPRPVARRPPPLPARARKKN